MDQKEVYKKAMLVLQNAPVKFRIDFDPYWYWYEQECIPMIALLQKELEDGEPVGVHDEQRKDSGSDSGTVGNSDRVVDSGTTPGQPVSPGGSG